MSNIKSFGDLDAGSTDGDSDGGDVNEFYAGGAKSGQVVRGAPKQDDEDDISSIFEKAKRAGAVQGSAEDLQQPGKEKASSFAGSGRTLAGGSAPTAAAAPSAVTDAAPSNMFVITFFRNNIFTVNDGPPRDTRDPTNRNFIESISRGECPQELEPEVQGTEIKVNLVKSNEDYAPPAKAKGTSSFQGSGRTLASGSAGPSGVAAGAAAAQGEWAGVNESQPTTSLQLRMADGSRMVARFNHSHQVSDIRRFIRASRPDVTYPYTLLTGLPPQPVAEENDQTLEEAGLLNSVIIQRK
mmetsp:Transcript_7103/g.12186  ORF Transcript_7103/g.12186 Transcript_7103/m.12186 type:complete len:297 (+) Transcript_7103:62-952(+)|eukprot:CAMPEP_0119107020 /NCGR_PEP_ID=MMETSP1180-20130426/7907_1 /TAXON_ID=3052 ORGANISM="Chlamydomonas cf sp, Strain CCMP681" /NCGR_SAMPLE_ID=MMETSP1180 /ASSEMBLY_ACC=CAM_ASM_000741 /LENGTH=296 /DNA_ID=CAMNT_0007092445 /DNA_START=62 /DNA_END=952 /DNA_ORIENTATION=-